MGEEKQSAVWQSRSLESTAEAGIIAGVVASFPTVLLGMLASLIRDRGVFTPMYQLAYPLDAGTFRQAVAQAGTGQPFYFVQEPFFFGCALSVAMGALFGLIFALAARALNLKGPLAVGSGLAYGLIVMALTTWVLLPWAGTALRSPPVGTPASSTGAWGLLAQYLAYGAVLGVWWSWGSVAKASPVGPGRAPETSGT